VHRLHVAFNRYPRTIFLTASDHSAATDLCRALQTLLVSYREASKPLKMGKYATLTSVKELDTLLSENTFVILDFWATWYTDIQVTETLSTLFLLLELGVLLARRLRPYLRISRPSTRFQMVLHSPKLMWTAKEPLQSDIRYLRCRRSFLSKTER
jgi:hypothetical protein